MAFLKNLFRCKLCKSRKHELEARNTANSRVTQELQPLPTDITNPVQPSPPYDATPLSATEIAEAYRRKVDLEMTPPEPTWKRLPLDKKLEEERNPGYRADTWYHVHIGEVINERYQVCTKLGWGDTSTVWLAKDLRNARYVSLKVCANPNDQRLRELDFLLHITRLYSDHPGAQSVATLLDHFRVHRRGYAYLCLVTNVLGPSLAVRVRPEVRQLEIDWLKEQLYRLLQAVDFLHSEAHIVHGDIWPPNVLCAIPDRRVLQALDDLEATQPSNRKLDGGRVIYESRAVQLTGEEEPSLLTARAPPVLIDFGNSRLSPDAFDLEHMRFLRESDNMRADEPYQPERDIQWIGRLFVGLLEGRALYKKNMAKEGDCTKNKDLEGELKGEESDLRALVWRMKNITVPKEKPASAADEEAKEEKDIGPVLTVKGLLRDQIFLSASFHHSW
ncbi:hypothetical protein PFICI_04815 [Pestalotiopsis fici W106-1]|uniref:non-specific serine/threonine protein kinase n=1 Tax=Pestalotiopsis fici (strain W106-1 / CGMCC3.15140) TaxID=1229662 RepID=W3XA83_PESFW|nr:uncharacterized protein PFICI_04815 [Pestalotiopsis fici W106-1]ETS82939.1 hypothetical protein PFICI_04815 [Pestalotiopsis fici W106-1]